MAGLRWILLIAGLVFLAALAWWERRRPRQARGEEYALAGPAEGPPTPEPAVAVPPRLAAASEGTAVPTLAPAAVPRAAKVPVAEPLKVVDWPAGRRVEPEMSLEVPVLAPAPARTEPALDDGSLAAPAAAARLEPSLRVPGVDRPALVVEWPPEGERRIVNLRVVPVRVDRFPGRDLRLSLTAAGFEHGRFGIYHLPGPEGRAIVSAASLTRPGILDPQNMDFQRFGGLNLFAVLPGPLPPAVTVDRLVDAACDIAQRLEGRVQNEDGMPLDEARLAELRRAATGGAAPAP